MLVQLVLLVFGLVVLIYGADILVDGAGSLARKMGISSIVVGLTVVAFGTSMPELIVNVFSALKGSTDLAIGNILGSNIANILLVLGISALILPIKVQRNTIWKEIPFVLLASVLLLTMGNDAFLDGQGYNAVTRTDGIALFAVFAIFLYYIFSISKISADEPKIVIYPNWRAVLMTVGGIVCLFLGGKFLVDNAVILARGFGLSEALIGLTIVAIGTSLPEIVTSVVASSKGQNDIAVGNVVGSNIFNVLWIVGLTSLIRPLPFSVEASFDALIALIAALLLFLVMFIGKRHTLERWQGAFFLVSYIVYLIFIVLRG